MTNKTLVAFTGGWESTFIKWKLMTETHDEITAVYLDSQFVATDIGTIKNAVQLIRAQKVVDELKKIRDFNFISYKIKSSDVTEETYLKYLQFVKYAAPFVNNGTYDKIVHGASYEDVACKILPHLDYFPTYYVVERYFSTVCTRGELSEPLMKGDWIQNYNRSYPMTILPDNIKNAIASCDTPKLNKQTNEHVDCGECRKCLENRICSEMLASGKTSEEIFQWRQQKSREYGNGILMAPLLSWIRKEAGLDEYEIPEPNIKQHPVFKDATNLNTGIWQGIFEP